MFARGNVTGVFRRGAFLLACLGFALVALPASAQKPLGVDVSHYDGTIDWPTVKSSGNISFAWAKATEYASTIDDTFSYNMTNAKAAGVYIGAYHFAHPEVNSPATEADFFWSVAGPYIKQDGLTMQPVLDFETFSGVVGATSYADWANQWCNDIVSKAAAVGITVKPVIYTSTCGAGNLDATDAQWIPWIANPSGNDPQISSPWSNTVCHAASDEIWGTGVWTAWQYSWTTVVPGITISGGGDVDVYNGDLTSLVTNLVIGTNPPPLTVTLSPRLNRGVDLGGSLNVTGVVTGLPLSYQWYLNGAKISGANASFYHLANVQLTNAGNYSLIITNASSSATSSVVSVLVYPLQTTVFFDNFDVNTATNWTLNTSSSDTAVTFNFDYSTLGIPSAPHSTGGTTRGVQMKANLANGVVAALSLSPTNQSFSGDYRVRFDAWINVNGPFPGGGAGSTEFLTGGLGTSGTRPEWTGNASADGYYFSINGDGGSGDTATITADVNAYIGPTVQPVATGDYWAGTDVTARGNGNAYYTTTFPAGKAAPALQQANYPQQTGNLSIGTFGLAWHDVIVSKRGSTVDWVVDGVRFVTISNATYTASNVFVGFWDPFASLSSNNVINFGLVDNVRVESPALIPAFTLQPMAKTVRLGTNVTFTAAATGLPAATYIWRLNGTNIPGATNASYPIAFVAATNTGNYSVIATNIAGGITSTNALLALVPPSAAQFMSVTVDGGGAVQVNFTGDAYWTYTIEVSTNLTSWTDLTNLTSASGVFGFTAGSVTNAPQQFFRARVGP
jgi:GH25 family lysozyme M1 (1,4-beta-N-acetylmuramidase)